MNDPTTDIAPGNVTAHPELEPPTMMDAALARLGAATSLTSTSLKVVERLEEALSVLIRVHCGISSVGMSETCAAKIRAGMANLGYGFIVPSGERDTGKKTPR